MTDYVQVPREATEEMLNAAEQDEREWRFMPRMRDRHARHWEVMLAAAPQATDPRDGATVATLIKQIAAEAVCDAYALENQQLFDRAEAAESRIATLTAERDAALAALTVARKYVAVAQHSPNALHEYRLEARCFLSEIDALTTQPSKTETRE